VLRCRLELERKPEAQVNGEKLYYHGSGRLYWLQSSNYQTDEGIAP
jgi:hypothetical protein